MTENEIKKLSELNQIKMFKNPATPEEDREIIGGLLYQKYEPMIHKHWWKLLQQTNNSPKALAIKEEYYDEAVEAFFSTIDKVNLSKIYDENFKLMQLASWYIGNVRIKWIKKLIKDSGTIRALNCLDTQETALGPDPEAEMAYWEKTGFKNEPSYHYEMVEGEEICNRAVKTCMEKWDEVQRQIFSWLKEKKTKTEIGKNLGINSVKLAKIINGMKADLEKELGLTA